MKKIAIILTSLLIVACSSTPKVDTPQAAKETPKPATPTISTAAPVSAAETESSKLAAELQQLQKQSVYFDFDQSSIKPEYRDVMQKQANFIKAHQNDVVTLKGNTDERGSNEYNLALGGKRAQAVKKALEILGVGTSQIKTVSYGAEKPRLACHEEKCWQENRRVDFDHQVN